MATRIPDSLERLSHADLIGVVRESRAARHVACAHAIPRLERSVVPRGVSRSGGEASLCRCRNHQGRRNASASVLQPHSRMLTWRLSEWPKSLQGS